ncbi:Serine hydroxymethyltransferase [bacterium HR19]|nr:Serine hydroxymethyltransferase [bacterium HR19]
MKVAIGSDHAGFFLKEKIKEFLKSKGIEFEDRGVDSGDGKVDYPDFARSVAEEVSSHRADLGILICGTGIGMSITANKFPGVRAALVFNEFSARMAKAHNDANIIVFPGRIISPDYAIELLKVFMESSFEGGRHLRRIEKIKEIEEELIFSLSHIFGMIRKFDPDVFYAIRNEIEKQENTLNLIASENLTSLRVLLSLFNPMNNKYAEGYPSKRYYGGCEFVDIVEEIARERVKKIFSAEHANVQPHSGTQANQAVFLGFLEPGDKIMSLELSSGGHLSHGAKVNFSGKIYQPVFYTVDERTHLLDLDKIRDIARRERPKIIIAGASSYPRAIDFKAFADIAKEVSAYLLADIAHPAGLVAAGVFPSPVPYADFVTFTTHKTLRGPRGAVILTKSDYAKKIDSAVFPGTQGGPFMHVIAAKAVCFKEVMEPDFKLYAEQVVKNAKALADEFQKLGYNVITGGTDSHIVLIDVSPKGVSGGDVERELYKAGIILNKNVIPFDKRPPMNPSGIRLGTSALTTRGMKEEEMRFIARMIDRVISANFDEKVVSDVRNEVREMCANFPFYRDLLMLLGSR